MPVYKSKAEKTKTNKIWYFKCCYSDLEGNKKQKKSKKYLTKEEATKEEARFLLSIGENVCNQKITFNYAYKELYLKKEEELRITTLKKINNYYKHIENTLGKIQINKLTLRQFKKWKTEMNNKDLCCSYKNKIYKLLCEIVRYAETHYNVTTNAIAIEGKFVDKNEKKKEMLFFTLEEFNKFLEVIDEQLWRTLFTVLFYCGLRQGELMALTWNDIDLDNKTIYINKTLTTKLKGEKYTLFPPKTKSSYRIIPITEKVKDELTTLYNTYNTLDGFNNNWFVFGGIYPTPETTIQKHKNAYCKKTGVKQIRIHDFRHSCASLLISKNADPVLVAKYLGHADVSMTLNRYAHLYKSKLNTIIKLIEK